MTDATTCPILNNKLIDYANETAFAQKGEEAMKVTISDVARLAGVSTATVSHTINNTRYVSDETKEKVYQAIAELGYTPDASARSFRTGKKKTVGFTAEELRTTNRDWWLLPLPLWLCSGKVLLLPIP